jgi:hypothetical protein
VYLLITLPILVVGGFCLIVALIGAYSRVTGVPRSAMPVRNGLLIALPAFFLWMPASLWLSNIVLRGIAPLRRVAEQFSARSGRPGFARSQADLLKVLGVFALICIPLIALGFLL